MQDRGKGLKRHGFILIPIIVPAIFLVWVLATAVLAQTELPPPYAGLKNPFPWSDTTVQETGKGSYQQYCLGCHGANGGNMAGADFSAADYPRSLEESPDLYFWILSEGRLDKGMPAFKSSLSEEQRWQVLTYLWSLGTDGTPAQVAIPQVFSSSEADTPLECLSCHTRALESHDILGKGSKACLVCHDSVTIGMLRLADGTPLPLEDSTQVCSQCHSGRYDAWQDGDHGVPSGRKAVSGVPLTAKVKCISCHNPHQPKIDLAAVGKPFLLPPTGEEAPLDCLSCHTRVLKGHDKLGEGSKACWSCHYNMEMGVLHLAGGEVQFSLADYPQLCAQCHQKRYEAWDEGTHGMPAWNEGVVEIHGEGRVGCIGCHDPHQPQIAFSGITEPHPPPQPPPSPPSVELLVMLGISLLLIIAVVVAMVTKGELP